ncbi:MAG: methyltransferase domain-containing protein [Chromatiales bacterium]|nr:methyltransferase domain-containing protein [Chromatiales bacterium]
MTAGDRPVIDRRQVRRSFARAAASYDDADVLQTEVRDRLLERLDLIRLEPRRVLDLGTGTGKALPALAARYPDAEIVGLDLTPAMLRVADARQGGPGRARPVLVCADAARLPFPDRSVDLVFSSLVIHWSPVLDQVLAEVRRVLRHPGLFTFSTPGPDSYRELRRAWRAVDEAPHVLPFPEMRALGDGLVRAGLAEPVLDTDTLTLQYREFSQLIADLRATGTTNASAGRRPGLTGRQAWSRLTGAYERERGADGLLPATIEVVFGQAWAAGDRRQRPSPGDEITVPLDSLGRRPP